MKLYELSAQYEQILEIAEESGSDDLKDCLDTIGDAIEHKAESIALIIRDLEARQSIFDQEIDRLDKKLVRSRKSVERLETYLLENLIAVGIHKINGRLVSISVANSNPGCKILDEAAIPDNFKTVTIELPMLELTPELRAKASKIDVHIRKSDILDIMKHDDFDVPGATIERKKRLIIR